MAENNSQKSRKVRAKAVIDEKLEYDTWTKGESDLLMELLVDAHKRGWRNSSGKFDKRLIERRILPVLNAKLNVQKTHTHYVNRMKTFKRRYERFQKLLKHSSGFGFDSETKKFTATEEIWKGFLQSHPSLGFLKNKSFHDYEDLDLIIGGGTCATRGITVSSEDTPKDVVQEDPVGGAFVGINSMVYAESSSSFTVAPEGSRDLFTQTSHPPSPIASPTHGQSPTMEEHGEPQYDPIPNAPSQCQKSKKRGRSESTSNIYSMARIQAKAIKVLTSSVSSMNTILDGIHHFLEDNKKFDDIWPAIEEVQGWDDETRYKAMDFLSTRSFRIMFARLTPKRRKEWLMFKLRQMD